MNTSEMKNKRIMEGEREEKRWRKENGKERSEREERTEEQKGLSWKGMA